MRGMLASLVLLAGLGCDKPAGQDAGGPVDSGTTAVCLDDRPDGGAVDGGAGNDFSCAGQPRGEGGQAELVITGKATTAGVTRPGIPNVQLDLLDTSGAVLATSVSDDAGVYRLAADTQCLPLDGEVRATHLNPDAGWYLSYGVPDAPWRYDRGGLELILFDVTSRNLISGLANAPVVQGTAALALTIEDCNGVPVAGASVRSGNDAGSVRYVGPAGFPSAAYSETNASGQLVIFNVPPGLAEVTVFWDGGVIAHRMVPVHGDAATGTTVHP